MNISRKTFLRISAGATALAVVSPKAYLQEPLSSVSKIKRGVSLYSYSEEYGVTMTLEDMLADMDNMGARGLEILANSHIVDYPNPSDAWVENWHTMLKKFNIVPVEYGNWIDSRLHQGRELSTQESYEMLIRDMKLADKLGFKIMRTKMGVIDDVLTPVSNWREIIQKALLDAEKYDIKMCPEIHSPTVLKSKMVDDYIDFIDKTKTKHFGLNIDFSVFRNKPLKKGPMSGMPANMPERELKPSLPSEIIPLLPYVFCCHAKFYDMSDDFQELTIPYDEVVSIMIKQKWNGYLLSEYEGPNKNVPGYSSDQLRKQHIMLINMLGA